MKKVLSVMIFVALAMALFLSTGTAAFAADYPAFYVGDTNVTATADVTTYWIKDTSASPSAEFTQTGAGADHYTFAVSYAGAEGYTLIADGLAIQTYADITINPDHFIGGIVCLAPLEIDISKNGLTVGETADGVFGIITIDSLNITGEGDLAIRCPAIAVPTAFTCDIDGAVTIASSGTAPVLIRTANINAGGDIEIKNTGTGMVFAAPATLTSENGSVTVNTQCLSPAIGGTAVINAEKSVEVINTASMAIAATAELHSKNGSVTVKGAGSMPTVGGNTTVNAEGDIEIRNTGTGMATGGPATLTSENGSVTVNAQSDSPAIGGAAVINAEKSVEVINTAAAAIAATAELHSKNGGVTVKGANNVPVVSGDIIVSANGDIAIANTGAGMAMGGTASLTSDHGAVTVSSKGNSPTVAGTATILADGDINIESTAYMVFANTSNLTSVNGKITVIGNGNSSPVIGDQATFNAKGDISVRCATAGGYVFSSTAALTSDTGAVTVTCDSSSPMINGVSVIKAAGDILLENTGAGAAMGNSTEITSKTGRVELSSNGYHGPAIIGDAEIKAAGDISVVNTENGSCVSGKVAFTSDAGDVTVTCDSSSPMINGVSVIKAAGDILLENTGAGAAMANATEITSKTGGVKISSTGYNGPAIIGDAEIKAAGDISVVNTEKGFCVSGKAAFTSTAGDIAVTSSTGLAPVITGFATLLAAGEITVKNDGSAPCFGADTALNSLDGNIDVVSAGNNAAIAPVEVKLGHLHKTATFTAAEAAVPAGFILDMPVYKVSGGVDGTHLGEITLDKAKDYACVRLEAKFAVNPLKINVASYTDDGDHHYTVTAAKDLLYGGDGVYIGVAFNGLSGENGKDYYLSYGDHAGVTWDPHKALAAASDEEFIALYTDISAGEKTVYVYYDPDGAGTAYGGNVITIDYQIPDGAVYSGGDGTYTWDGSVWVKAGDPFSDVSRGAWYYDDVMFAYENGLIFGTGNGKFSPEATMTRADLITILWRLEGKPEAGEAMGFKDVTATAYYAKAVAWAAEEGIIQGYSAEKFGPKDNITREQLVTILYRYATGKGYDISATTDLSAYSDAGKISAYALNAVKWANAEDLMRGTSSTTLDPVATATRAQAAAIIHRFITTVAVMP